MSAHSNSMSSHRLGLSFQVLRLSELLGLHGDIGALGLLLKTPLLHGGRAQHSTNSFLDLSGPFQVASFTFGWESGGLLAPGGPWAATYALVGVGVGAGAEIVASVRLDTLAVDSTLVPKDVVVVVVVGRV